MLVDVVAIPLDHRPIELLPPGSRNRKPVAEALLNAAIADGSKKKHCRSRSRRQFLNMFWPLSKAGSSPSDPAPAAYPPPPAPRDIQINLRTRHQRRQSEPTTSEIVPRPQSSACNTPCCPAAVQSIAPPLGASRTTAKISRAACESPSPTAAPRQFESPDILPPESKAVRRKASAT